MDSKELMELITVDDIKKLMEELGSEYCNDSNPKQIIFDAICHGSNSHKLYYYPDNKMFYCYSQCGHSYSLFDLVQEVLGLDKFSQAFSYVMKFKGLSNSHERKKGLQLQYNEIEDMKFLRRHKYTIEKQNYTLKHYDESVLNVFDNYYPDVWEQEGMKPEIMKYFGIQFYFNQFKAIIPIRDINGYLIGIRGRAFKEKEIKANKKYMPVTIQNITYKYPTALSLYGLYENKDNIKRKGRCILFEGEKSPIKYGSYYGQENNISLGNFGMSISVAKRDILLSLGIRELTIGFDKQYQLDLLERDDNSKEVIEAKKEYNAYIKKIIKIYKMFSNYCIVSLIYCDNNDLDYKDAPIDKGKEIFTKLDNERIIIDDIEELEESMYEI